MSIEDGKESPVHTGVKTWMQNCWRLVGQLHRGLLLCWVVAMAASFIAVTHGGPPLLFALLMGVALHFLSHDPGLRPGIEFCARTALRMAVALLGLRISLSQVTALGWQTASLAVAAVTLTVAAGWLLARLLRRPRAEGLISGCAVGICGASAALAVASVLPATRENERFTLLAVVGVTLLSTLAMLVYPMLARMAELTPTEAGIFLGATIHDVAQVVAAGTLMQSGTDTTVADSATVVKLTRVALLVPVIVLIALLGRHASASIQASAVPKVPGFLLAFVVLVAINSSGLVPHVLSRHASTLSTGLLTMAIAAAGIKTSLADLRQVGWRPALLLGIESAVLALFVLISLGFMR